MGDIKRPLAEKKNALFVFSHLKYCSVTRGAARTLNITHRVPAAGPDFTVAKRKVKAMSDLSPLETGSFS